MSRMPIAILISGRGTNMEALLEACAKPDYPAEPVLVLSNRPDAKGLEFAGAAGVPTQVIDHKAFDERSDFDAAIHEAIAASGAELICLAGFMRIVGEAFIRKWPDRIINIHPSLLPAYRGLHTHRRVLEDGVRIAGCTVHFVVPEMDAGPIILKAAVPVLPHDDEDSLAARVLGFEHQIYPEAVKLVASGRTNVVDGRVPIDGDVETEGGLVSPTLSD